MSAPETIVLLATTSATRHVVSQIPFPQSQEQRIPHLTEIYKRRLSRIPNRCRAYGLWVDLDLCGWLGQRLYIVGWTNTAPSTRGSISRDG